ncbi:importin subunit alpha-8-like [Convolutriloba macropyga]|uniref:importin subunit alpha-8-like n=1 Tax=Convolutriloba macropyga TaxID=536237 RepID=UPI003F51D02D
MTDQENRLRKFKNVGKDLEERRCGRQENQIELRKNKKDEQLMKRRNIEPTLDINEPLSPVQLNNNADEKNSNAGALISEPIMSLDEIQAHIDNVSDPVRVLSAVRSTRRLLSRERNPPIGKIIDANLIPSLVKYLMVDDNPLLQFEAAWAITNIASGTTEQTKAVVKSGAVEAFVHLLESDHMNVVEQAVWALGNIAGDGAPQRDRVTEAGAVPILIKLSTTVSNLPMLRNITWTISNLCRNKNPQPKVEVIQQLLPTLKLLLANDDRDIMTDACWALSYITDSSDDRIQLPLDHGILPRLVHLLHSNDPRITTPALRTVGNIVTGNDQQTQMVIDEGGLNAFGVLLNHQKNNIVKEAAWALSNITAGNTSQIQAFLDAGLLTPVIEVLKGRDFKSQKEAAWVITNLSTGGEVQQILQPVQANVMEPYGQLLDCQDVKIVQMVLEGLRNFLMAAKQINQVEIMADVIEESHTLEKIEQLQHHTNEEIYKQAYAILEEFFSEDQDSAGLTDGTAAHPISAQVPAEPELTSQGALTLSTGGNQETAEHEQFSF